MYGQRLQALRHEMVNARLDALLVTHIPHVRYLTGFTGSNGLCFVTKRSRCFITDLRYRDQSREEVRGFRLVTTRNHLLEAAATQAMPARKVRIGFESQDLSVARFRALKAAFPRAKLVPTTSIVERLTSVKDRLEIECIRKAVRISDRVFDAIIQMLRPGLAERDVAAEIAYLHRKYGAEADAFEPIVASGGRGALPHARASAKTIRQGELVLLDFGCRVAGYHSDLTRTVAIGKPSARSRTIYEVVLDAQMQAIGAARSGVPASDLDAIARSRVRKSGYGRYFCHSLGHGLGLRVHEPPRLSSLSKDVLQRGNVVTIEPGIYIPGFGGVRIEDDVVVHEDRSTVLNKSPKELLVL